MRINNNSIDIKTQKIDNIDYVLIDLDLNTVSKLPLQILYYKEHGFNYFLINYDYNLLKIPASKVVEKIKIEYILRIAKEYDVKFKFKGFPRCVYEKNILRPGLRWYYENYLSFFNCKEEENCKDTYIKLPRCNLCVFDGLCRGINENYIKQFGEKEFSSLISNKELYDLNLHELETFSNEELKKIGSEILLDYKDDNHYLRKRFVFVKSIPDYLEESAKERFVYYIYNRKDDFEKTFELATKYFDKNFLNLLKEYLILSNQIAMSFGLMGDQKIRKTFYFSIEDLSLDMINSLSKLIKTEIKHKNPGIIGIDFKEDSVSFKVYYSQKQISVLELKAFAKDIILENKRLLLKFSNSLTKPLNHVLLDYKYKDGKLYSKRVDISMQYNVYRTTQFYALFQIPLSFFEGKEIYTLSFEMRDGGEEKINFYYALTLPEPVEPEFLEEDEGN